MTKDYLKAVAAAYGAGDPRLHDIGEKALREIDGIRAELAAQGAMIRQLMGRVPGRQLSLSETGSAGLKVAEGGGRLSEAMKDQIREYAQREYDSSGRWLSPQELVDRMGANGVTLDVSQPIPSVGTVLAALRKQTEVSPPRRSDASASADVNSLSPRTHEEACLALLTESAGAPMTLRDLVDGLREHGWMRTDIKTSNAIETIRGTMRTLLERQPGRVVKVQDSPVAYALHPADVAGGWRPATRFTGADRGC